MVGQNLRSRSNRRRKKRKNNRNLTIVLALAFLFFTILLAAIVLNKNDDSEVEQEEPTEEQQVNETEKDTKDNESDSIEYKKEDDPNDDNDDKIDEENKEKEKEEEEEEEEKESSVSIRELDPEEIEGSNIIKAYEGDWEPVGTNQAGEHTTNYQNGSEDRMEIKRAVSDVTDVPEDDMVEWRVENGGDQQVISTVSDSNEEEYFRIYLTWIDNEGWQVEKLEHLKENDKK